MSVFITAFCLCPLLLSVSQGRRSSSPTTLVPEALQLDADTRKDALTRRKRGDFVLLSMYPIIHSYNLSFNQTTISVIVLQQLPCSHRAPLKPQTAAVREDPSLSCCSVCLWFICFTRPGCCTASSTPNPATEAEESTASPPIWQQDPDCRLAQAFVSYSCEIPAWAKLSCYFSALQSIKPKAYQVQFNGKIMDFDVTYKGALHSITSCVYKYLLQICFSLFQHIFITLQFCRNIITITISKQ